jgi:hypothetical protein
MSWLRVAAPLVATFVFSLAALSPLLSDSIPRTHDAAHHLQRLVALHDLMREGVMLSRWLPEIALGFGAPVFDFYAPLSYLPSMVAIAVGLGYVDAWRLGLAIAPLLGAVGMAVALRPTWGAVAAIAGGTTFGLAPYMLYDLHVRGALAEVYAIAILPWCVAAGLWLARSPSRFALGAVGVTTAALVLSHHITAALALPVLGALPFFVHGRDRLARGALGLGLGLVLSALYWLPAVLESGLVRLEVAVSDTAGFARNFIAGPPWLVSMWPYSYAARPGPVPVQMGLIVVAGLLCLIRRPTARGLLAWAALLGVGSWLFQTPLTLPVYDAARTLQFIQYPFRLLAFTSLAAAIAAAGLVAAVGGRARIFVAVAVISATTWHSLGTLDLEHMLVEDRYLSAESTLRAEIATLGIATTLNGEFIPMTAPAALEGGRLQRRLIAEGSDAPRSTLPSPIEIRALTWSPDRIEARVTARASDRLTVRQFAFPGWTASIDGVAANAYPSPVMGGLSVDVPPGDHVVEFRFGWTTMRLVALVVSVVSAGLFAIWIGRIPRRGVLAVVLLLTPGCARAVHPPGPVLGLSLDDHMTVLTAGLDQSRLPVGGPLVVTTDAFVRRERGEAIDASVGLEWEGGFRHEARGSQWAALRLLERGTIARLRHDLRVPPDAPGGRARAYLAVEHRGGSTSPVRVDLGEVILPDRPRPAPPAAIRINEWLDLEASRLDMPLADLTVVPIDSTIEAQLDLRVLDAPRIHLSGLIGLVGSGGRHWATSRPIGEWFNTQPGWQRGDRVVHSQRLRVPRNAQPGNYDLAFRVESAVRPYFAPTPLQIAGRDQPEWTVTLARVRVRG